MAPEYFTASAQYHDNVLSLVAAAHRSKGVMKIALDTLRREGFAGSYAAEFLETAIEETHTALLPFQAQPDDPK